MPEPAAGSGVRDLVLVMRKGYAAHGDHIACLLAMGIRLHLVTEIADARCDARFASVTVLTPGMSGMEAFGPVAAVGRRHAAAAVITFQETDILVAAMANDELSVPWERVEAHRVARDKTLQRRFLQERNLPTVQYREIRTADDAKAAGRALGFPCVVKPSRAANSHNVTLVKDEPGMLAALAGIDQLARSTAGNYFTDAVGPTALAETYLPGEEACIDGVVLDGRFIYAGTHNKQRQDGPYFEEDLYSLPSKIPERELELKSLAEAIATELGLRYGLLNVEVRQDRDGAFRVVEFSTRISGGLLYRNLRDAHGLDLVRTFAKGILTGSAEKALHGEVPRLPPRMATCCKGVYVDGVIVRNFAGRATLSPYFSGYISLAPPGTRVATAPRGFDLSGVLSVRYPFRDLTDVTEAERVACDLHDQLDVVVNPVDGPP